MSDLGDQIRTQADLIDASGNAIRDAQLAAASASSLQLQALDARESDLRIIAAQVDGLIPPPPETMRTTWEQNFKGCKSLDLTVWKDWGAGNYGDAGTQHEDAYGLLRNISFDGTSWVGALRKEDYDIPGTGITPDPAHWTGTKIITQKQPFSKGSRLSWQGILNAGRNAVWTASLADDGEFDLPEQFFAPSWNGQVSAAEERYAAFRSYSLSNKHISIRPTRYGERLIRGVNWCVPGPNAADAVFWRSKPDGSAFEEIFRIAGDWVPATAHDVRIQVVWGGMHDSGYKSGIVPTRPPPPNERALVVATG